MCKRAHCNLQRHDASRARLATVSTDDFIETIGPNKRKCHNYHTRAELFSRPGGCSRSWHICRTPAFFSRLNFNNDASERFVRRRAFVSMLSPAVRGRRALIADLGVFGRHSMVEWLVPGRSGESGAFRQEGAKRRRAELIQRGAFLRRNSHSHPFRKAQRSRKGKQGASESVFMEERLDQDCDTK